MRTLAITVGTAIGIATLLGAGQASADTLVYSTGFEAPAYHLGALAGQQGWTGNTGVVENSLAYAGSQAVEFNATGLTVGSAGDLTMLAVSSDGPMMQVSDEFYASASDANVVWTVLSLGGNNSGAPFIGALFADSSGVLVSGSGASAYTQILFGQWNSYTLDINFTTQTLTGYLNGTLIGTEGFAQSNTELTEVGFGIDGANGHATTQAYVDNVSVETVAEPGSLMLFAAGLLGLGVGRRRLPAA
jgi:hypothetical protein